MEMAMITGMHAVVYTRDAEADRAFFRDVLGFSSVDAGGGWLIFAAPPSELACHPAESNGKHELYLMCDDLRAERYRVRPRQRPGLGPPIHSTSSGRRRSRPLRAASPDSLSAEPLTLRCYKSAALSHLKMSLPLWGQACRGRLPVRSRAGRALSARTRVATIPPAIANTTIRVPAALATCSCSPIRLASELVATRTRMARPTAAPMPAPVDTIAAATPCSVSSTPVAAAMNMLVNTTPSAMLIAISPGVSER